MRADKRFDRLHGPPIDLPLEIERSERGNAAPLTIRLTTKHLVVKLDLVRGLNDGRRTFVRTGDIAGGVLVGSRQDVDTRLIGMAPRFFESQEIVLRAFPSNGKRHRNVLTGCKGWLVRRPASAV